MPESVTDIVHRITYESNTDVIESLNKAFGNQFKLLKDLQAEEARLNQLIASTGKQELAQQQALNAALTKTKTQIDQVTIALGKEFAANEKLSQSFVKATANTKNLGFAFSQILREAPAFAFSIQTGLLGISNNIPILLDQLALARASGTSTAGVFKALGASLFGFTGLMTIAISVLTIFGDKIFDFTSEAEKAQKATDKLAEEVKKLKAEVLSFKEPTFYDTIEENIEKTIQADKRRAELLKVSGASNVQVLAAENAIRDREILALQDEIKLYESRTTSILRFDKEISENKQKIADLQNQKLVETRKVENQATEERLKEAEELKKKYEEVQEAIQDALLLLNKGREGGNARRNINALGFEEEPAGQPFGNLTPDQQAFNAADAGRGVTFLTAEQIAEQKRNDEKLAKDKKDSLDKQVQYYTDAANAIIGTFQLITDAKVQALDFELEVTQSRIIAATELAKRGNSEVLEDELRNLNRLQEEREKAGQKQLALNSVMAASTAALSLVQSIQAITASAALPPPANLVAIAATVSALASGIAFATSVVTAARGFKDGVIGLDGAGTATSDSIAARLSKGESVITAEKTQRYRPVLEAIHAGTFERSFPTYNNYASKTEMKGVERKLDRLIELNMGGGTEVKNMVSGGDLVTVTQKHTLRQQNRWKRG